MSHDLVEFDTEKAHSARMYDYYLGGKDHYPADREAASQVMEAFPETAQAARANREFVHRAARFAAHDGVRQFLDIGTGIPTEPNLHNAVQAVDPRCRVVYVDHDPLVLAHAQALMIGSEQGRTAFIPSDVRDPDVVLRSDAFRAIIDLSEPVALNLAAVMHFITDEEGAYDIVRAYLDAFAPGSYLSITHASSDLNPETFEKIAEVYARAGMTVALRDKAGTARFFDGLDLVEPGVVPLHRWRPNTDFYIPEERLAWADRAFGVWAGVGIKR
ncbi:SAM-dependent methyltransferase [Nocardia spumae]|uniref:SAM-dependent methyltransferase n=1 Tax=Nocardia spumae TaxID=2887190 RepID=UPI001D1340B7|nr:SAM-dependent methyltransferase [Nocardia spumae]